MELNGYTKSAFWRLENENFWKKALKMLPCGPLSKKPVLPKAPFYGYYDSKEALFDALVSPAADGLLNQFKQAQASAL